MDYELYAISGNENVLPVYVETIAHNDNQKRVVCEKGFAYNQLILSLKGSAVIEVGSKKYSIDALAAVLVPAHMPYEYYPTSSGWEISRVTFAGYGVNRFLENINMLDIRVDNLQEIGKLGILYNKIYETIKNDRIYGSFYASGYMYDLFLEYIRIINKKMTISEDCTILPVLDYIDKRLCENIKLDDMCKIINVSPQHLCRLFQKYLKLRPNEYIAIKRVNVAKRLLIYTDKKIFEIAKEVGFNSTDYFTMIFKKYEKILPSDFRKKMK